MLPKAGWDCPKAGVEDPNDVLPKAGWEAGVPKGDGPAAGVPKGELLVPNWGVPPVPAPLHPSCSSNQHLRHC